VSHERVLYGVQGSAIFLAAHGSPHTFRRAGVTVKVEVPRIEAVWLPHVDFGVINTKAAPAPDTTPNGHGERVICVWIDGELGTGHENNRRTNLTWESSPK
jgi:hypothetical protein